jgi:hypothetical protein
LPVPRTKDDFCQYHEQGWFLPVPRTGMIFASTKNRDDFCLLSNWLQLFSSENCFPKVVVHDQNRKKMTILKGFIWFQLFFIDISYFIF